MTLNGIRVGWRLSRDWFDWGLMVAAMGIVFSDELPGQRWLQAWILALSFAALIDLKFGEPQE